MKKKYDEISERLRRRIEAGEYQRKLPGLRVLAREFHADFKTVRKALDKLIRENIFCTRERSGIYLAEGQHMSIGIIGNMRQESFFEDSYYREVCRGILNVIAEKGDVFSYQVRENRRYVHLFKNHSTVDAFLVFAPPDELLTELDELKKHIHFVVLGRSCNGKAMNYVTCNHFLDTEEGVTHLIRQGHRRIAFVGSPTQSWVHRVRLQAYTKALAGHHIPFDESLVALEHPADPSFHERVRRLLEPHHRVTAIFGASRGPMQKALEIIGNQVAKMDLVVYDDIQNMFKRFKSHYHAIEQPMMKLGETAVTILYRLLNGEATPPVQVTFRSKLVEKG